MKPENLPPWVIQLVAGLTQYENEHPKLYAQFSGSSEWQRADCPGVLLEAIPPEVRAFTAGWRAAQRRIEADKEDRP